MKRQLGHVWPSNRLRIALAGGLLFGGGDCALQDRRSPWRQLPGQTTRNRGAPVVMGAVARSAERRRPSWARQRRAGSPSLE
jgi:hypothetical protein